MERLNKTLLRAVLVCMALLLVAPIGAQARAKTTSGGGATFVAPPPPAERGRIVDGIAIPPKAAPARVKNAIAAANRIVTKPYLYGGGHAPFSGDAMTGPLARGYDCSSTISHALWGGRFLKSPLDSSSFMGWGNAGKGNWITVYTNPGHAYVVIAGLRLDTSVGDRASSEDRRSGRGPRWRTYNRSPGGFTARHPAGY